VVFPGRVAWPGGVVPCERGHVIGKDAVEVAGVGAGVVRCATGVGPAEGDGIIVADCKLEAIGGFESVFLAVCVDDIIAA